MFSSKDSFGVNSGIIQEKHISGLAIMISLAVTTRKYCICAENCTNTDHPEHKLTSFQRKTETANTLQQNKGFVLKDKLLYKLLDIMSPFVVFFSSFGNSSKDSQRMKPIDSNNCAGWEACRGDH